MDREQIKGELRNLIKYYEELKRSITDIFKYKAISKKYIKHRFKDEIREKIKEYNKSIGLYSGILIITSVKQDIKRLQTQLNEYDRRSKTQDT